MQYILLFWFSWVPFLLILNNAKNVDTALVSTTYRENPRKTRDFFSNREKPEKNRDFGFFHGKPGNTGNMHMIFRVPETVRINRIRSDFLPPFYFNLRGFRFTRIFEKNPNRVNRGLPVHKKVHNLFNLTYYKFSA